MGRSGLTVSYWTLCQASCKHALCFTSRNFRIICSVQEDTGVQRRKEDFLATKVIRGRRGIPARWFWQQSPWPSHHSSHGFLQVQGILVLFRKQENPDDEDWIGFQVILKPLIWVCTCKITTKYNKNNTSLQPTVTQEVQHYFVAREGLAAFWGLYPWTYSELGRVAKIATWQNVLYSVVAD